MACDHPLRAYKTAGGVIFAKTGNLANAIELPCGRCRGCRLERARQWAIRIINEASLYQNNSYVTLTYKQTGPSLTFRDFQLWTKKLRKKYPYQIRFYMCGEYGEENQRPHFHACLFNHDWQDKIKWKKNKQGDWLYTSAELTALWGHGHASTGAVTFQSAGYVARYIMDKKSGKDAASHYQHTDQQTGEITHRTPEFNKMSLRPGIGHEWLRRYQNDVYPHGAIVANNFEQKPPRYYDQLYERGNPEAFTKIKETRATAARNNYADNSKARRAVKATVREARMAQQKRTTT